MPLLNLRIGQRLALGLASMLCASLLMLGASISRARAVGSSRSRIRDRKSVV